MGLGAPKRRNKYSHDPNNTTWSRSTSNFGHRILCQQGWQPGQYLGAENASHSDHYTAANASHVRILLREDNLGLGAKIGGNKAETFGLSLFSGVLGRLNGKSDAQVQRQQDALREAELRQYQAGKYGLMNFVSGGLLVGDKIETRGGREQTSTVDANTAESMVERKVTKRKAEDDSDGEVRSKHKKRKSSKTRSCAEKSDLDQSNSSEERRLEKSHKKTKKHKHISDGADASETSAEDPAGKRSKNRKQKASPTDPDTPSADEKARLKQEKRARKEERRKRKEAKRLKRAQQDAEFTEQAEKTPKPMAQSVSGDRHAVRHRYIQQKRMAGMDAQAMKEIFMIKAGA